VSFRLPKLDAGISVEDQLYIVNNKNQAKIAHELAVLDDGGEGTSNTKALNVLKASKSDVPPLSRKDKQKVCFEYVMICFGIRRVI
jgi:hypothetical protein